MLEDVAMLKHTSKTIHEYKGQIQRLNRFVSLEMRTLFTQELSEILSQSFTVTPLRLLWGSFRLPNGFSRAVLIQDSEGL